jgi:hypothetical protein
VSYPAQTVQHAFNHALADASVTPELAGSLVVAIVDACADRSKDARAAAERRQAETQRVESRIHELISLRTDQLISDEEFVAQRSHLRRRLAEMSSDGVPSAPLLVSGADVTMMSEALADPVQTWHTAPQSARQVLGRLLMPEGFVFRGGKTPRKGLIFAVAQRSSAPSKTLAALVRENLNTLVDELQALLSIVKRRKPDVKDAA